MAMLAGAIALLPSAATAHVDGTMHGHFATGFLHPLLGADHVLAMLAVGIWGAQLGGRSLWALPASFMTAMVLAAFAGMAGYEISYVELGIAASVAALGLAVAFAWQAHERVALALVSAFAALHGYAHGIEIPSAAAPAAYAAGFTLATALIHATGAALGIALSRPLHGALPKVAGLAIMTSGALLAMR